MRKPLTKRRSTIHLIRPREKSLADRDSIENHTPLPLRLLPLRDVLDPLALHVPRAPPQRHLIILAPPMDKCDRVLLRLAFIRSGTAGSGKGALLFPFHELRLTTVVFARPDCARAAPPPSSAADMSRSSSGIGCAGMSQDTRKEKSFDRNCPVDTLRIAHAWSFVA